MAVAPRNDFLVWAGGSNANVLTQAEYSALGNLTSGVVSGKASAQHANKVWRQTSIMAAMIAKFIVDRVNQPVVDDGTLATIETNFIAAIASVFVIPPTGVVPGVYGPTMSLSVQADGRITALANGGLTGTGIAPGTYVGTTVTVGADGRITGIVGVPYGPLANNNLWAQTQRGAGGFVATATDSGNFHFRAIAGVGVAAYGSGIFNDASYTYLLSTVAGQSTGSFSAYRPFYWNMATGAVTIDATARGITTGGSITALTGNITANTGQLRAAVGAFGSVDTAVAVILQDYQFIKNGNDQYTYHRFPSGMIMQSSSITSVTGADFITFPNAFPNACTAVTVQEGHPEGWTGGGGVVAPTIFGAQQLTRFAFACYVATFSGGVWHLTGSVSTRYIAFGY